MPRHISVDMEVADGEYTVILKAQGIAPKRFTYPSEAAAREALRAGFDMFSCEL